MCVCVCMYECFDKFKNYTVFHWWFPNNDLKAADNTLLCDSTFAEDINIYM